EATALAGQGQRATYCALVLAPFSTFVRVYFRRGEWRRGTPGLITALFAAYELRRAAQRQDVVVDESRLGSDPPRPCFPRPDGTLPNPRFSVPDLEFSVLNPPAPSVGGQSARPLRR